MTEPVAASTEVDKTLEESVPADQGQLLRAAEPDQGVLKVKTQRQGDTVEFTRSLLGDHGEAADDLHRRQQDPEEENASVDRTDIATMTGPNEVTEYKVRVDGDRLDEWRYGRCSLKCQTGATERILQNTVDHTKVFALRFGSKGIIHQTRGETDTCIQFLHVEGRHKCDSDRRAAWTVTHSQSKLRNKRQYSS